LTGAAPRPRAGRAPPARHAAPAGLPRFADASGRVRMGARRSDRLAEREPSVKVSTVERLWDPWTPCGVECVHTSQSHREFTRVLPAALQTGTSPRPWSDSGIRGHPAGSNVSTHPRVTVRACRCCRRRLAVAATLGPSLPGRWRGRGRAVRHPDGAVAARERPGGAGPATRDA